MTTSTLAAAAAIATFHSLGLYWSPPQGGADNAARVEFREAGASSWQQGLAPWFDPRNREYRGSLVELKPGTEYEVRLTLANGPSETLKARTWSETPRIKRTVQIPPGTTHLVINAADSGDEKEGYVVFTAPPGRNVIDQGAVPGNDAARDNCIVVRQGTHHVIIRGLVLRNCKRSGIMLERQVRPELNTQTRDIVIEDNEISGWGGFDNHKPGRQLADRDAAVQCNYYRESEDAKRPGRIVVQRNTMRDPRHSANPWQAGSGPRKHPAGPLGVFFVRCGTNHVIRYNDIYSKNGKFFLDGVGGEDNFSSAGFPWADSDIYGNRISQAYDDAIEADGGNRNVRIWGNYLDETFVAISAAPTALGPLYVWRNVSNRMANIYQPDGDPDRERRGPFVKAGSNHATANGGRAYYFHNTVLQPPGKRYTFGAGWGLFGSAGPMTNAVSRNNVWHIHKEVQIHGQAKFQPIGAGRGGAVDAGSDVGRPAYASSGASYPDLAKQPGNFQLKPGSPGYHSAEPIPNFNRGAGADAGAHQSGTPPMRFGREAFSP
jgi:hypothetical protein